MSDPSNLTEFNRDEYYGNARAPFDGVITYPDSLVVGDSLFPMIYIYYYGDTGNSARIGNRSLFDQGLSQYFTTNMQMVRGAGQSSLTGEAVNTEVRDFTNRVKSFYRMMVDSFNKNRNYMFTLQNAVSTLMATYRTRLPQNRGSYYSNADRTRFDYFPVIDTANANSLEACMETLRLLFENSLISYDHNLGLRPINLYTGDFAQEDYEFNAQNDMARVLGLPTKGMFTINNRPRTDYMFKTFSGIDIIPLASLNTVVSKLEGMTQISWSIHKGKQPQRTLGRATSASRAEGSRTIAGTMIFTLADHHPLLELLPGDYPVSNRGTLGKEPEFWRPPLMPDQLPPFDLMITMTNEYGYASIVSLYGIQVVDEGTVLGVDNLITECVIQYTAVAMDPITAVRLDENGDIDPYGILQGGYSRLWKQRDAVVAGVAYTDLEAAYEAQYDAILGSAERQVRPDRRRLPNR